MNVFESRGSRRLLVRLDRGEELVDRVEALARREGIKAAWIRGLGSLEWVELDRHDQARRTAEPPARFETPCDILTLEGNVAMVAGAPRALLHASLARRTDNGIDVLGGRLRSGRVFAVELWIEVFDDLQLARAQDAATGLALWVAPGDAPRESVPEPRPAERSASAPRWARPARPEPEPVAAPRTLAPVEEDAEDELDEDEAPSGAVSWADVAAVSAAPPVDDRPSERAPVARGGAPKRAADDEGEELLPQKGDWVDHRQFGVCRVEREDEDGGLVIRLPSGVRKVIKLDYMEVGRPRAEPNRRVFPLRPRKR
jgi:predicted DNA-binding protein with PD1-like motif